jgi:pseudaminic acid cytidylyltransferase
MHKKAIAIITARGGSKRIPKKNIKLFLGKPIIKYSIEAALATEIFEEVMVSTDDEEIAAIAVQAGAKVPFMRSLDTSNDFATTAEVLVEVLQEYKTIGHSFDLGCCIYPTAPFVTAEKLKNTYHALLQSGATSAVPVTRFSFPIWRGFKIEAGRVDYIWPEFALKRSQDLSATYHDCGQFYFFDVNYFLEHKKLITDYTIPIEMPELEVQDIDNEEDWKIAEFKYSFLLQKNK